jgi:hypothetical protein
MASVKWSHWALGVGVTLIAVRGTAQQTKLDLGNQGKNIDFSQFATTKPVRTGTTLSGTCSQGELFFKTDAPAGQNLYACTSANVWTSSGAANVTIQNNGTNVGTRAAVNYIPGLGILSPLPISDDPADGRVDVTVNADTAFLATHSTVQSGAASYGVDLGMTDAYAITMSPVPASYTTGMVVRFKARTANLGDATLDVNVLGAKPILKHKDLALTDGDIQAGQIVTVVYDSDLQSGSGGWQLQSQTGGARYDYLYYAAAVCQGATPTTGFHLPASGAPTASCSNGTNVITGVLAFNDTTPQSVQGSFALPDEWAGSAIPLRIRWRAATATSNNTVWELETACVGADASAGSGGNNGPSFSQPQTVSSTASGTAQGFVKADLAAITTTGCGGGSQLFYRFSRAAADASDTMTGNAELHALRFGIQR